MPRWSLPVAAVVAVLVAVSDLTAATSTKAKVNFHYALDDPLVQTTSVDNFRDIVLDPTLPVVVNVYSPKYKACAEFGAVFRKTAEVMAGHALFAGLDASTEGGKQLAQMFSVSAFPTTLLFNPEMMQVQNPNDPNQQASFMKVPVPYDRRERTVEALTKFLVEKIDGESLTRIEDLLDYRQFVDQHKAIEIPKVVLVTSSNHTAPNFKAVAHEFRYGALFGVVHHADLAQAQAAARGDAKKVTLRGDVLAQLGLGQPLPKEAASKADRLPVLATITTGGGVGNAETVTLHRQVADGDFGLQRLKQLVSRVAWPLEKRREMMMFFLEEKKAQLEREAREAKRNKPLPPVTAYDEATWDETCMRPAKKSGSCAAVFVEDPDDEAALSWLEDASKSLAQKARVPCRLVVLSGPQNPKLATFFGASDMGFPTVVFIHPGRSEYHNLVGSFSARGVTNFFVDRASKKGKKYDAKSVPKFVAAHAADDDADADIGGVTTMAEEEGDPDEIIVED